MTKPNRTELCCCLCECSNNYTKGVSCCFCFPIKAGIVLIGITTWLIAVQQFLGAYMLFHNYSYPWWFPFVTILLFIPGLIGVCFFIGWFTLDCDRTRGNLTAANIMQLISYVLVLTWHVCYYCLIDKRDMVATGFGEDTKSYQWRSKKYVVYYELAWGVVGIAFFILALTAIRSYVNSYGENSEKTTKTPYELEQEKKNKKN